MARPCSTCKRKDVDRIDARLLSGVPLAQVAREWRLNEAALTRHKRHALTAATAKAARAATLDGGKTMIEQLRDLQVLNHEIARAAVVAGDLRLAAGSLREAARLADVVMQMELSEPHRVHKSNKGREEYESSRDRLIKKLLDRLPTVELPDISGTI